MLNIQQSIQKNLTLQKNNPENMTDKVKANKKLSNSFINQNHNTI